MKKSFKTNLIIFLLSGIIFLAATMPFRDIFSVFTVSEVRPAAVLNPFLGISFGIPASLGIAAANFIADGLSGYPVAVLLEGLVPQFLYCYVPFLLWRFFTKGEDHIHRLDSVMRVIKFTVTILVYAVLSGICVATIVYVNFGADFWNCAFFVFLNNFTMSMVLGCPLMIVSNQIISRKAGSDRTLTTNERIIICAAIAEFIIIAAVIFFVYSAAGDNDIYDIWNNIYLYFTKLILCFMVLIFAVMIFFESIGKAKKDK